MNVLPRDLLAFLHNIWVPRGLLALALLFMILQIWTIGQSIWQSPQITTNPSLKIAALLPEKLPPQVLNLFGEYLSTGQDMDIKTSMLDVDIVGILYASAPKESQVILRLPNGEEKNYRVGDTIDKGAVIKKINQDSIVILYHARLERINLQKSVLHDEKMPKLLFSE